jgi:hypothetical protein
MNDMNQPDPKESAPPPKQCLGVKQRQTLVLGNFEHTRKRLAQKKVIPLIQFCVFAYNCDPQYHGDAKDILHTDFVSEGSSVQVPQGLEYAIGAVEALLKALKEKQA